MVINPLKAFLFLAGGTAAAVGTAYVSGALDPYLSAPPVQIAALPEARPEIAAPKGERLPGAEPVRPANEVAAPAPAAPVAQGPVVPSFDVVRVEPDGSVVIAGRAGPGTQVELLVGADAIGIAKADALGDFAIVLDKPLAPGDYQLTLRSTPAVGAAVASAETAVISVPKTPNGPVLALVEEPGKPSEVITAPQPAPAPSLPAAKPGETAAAPTGTPATPADPAPAPVPAPATAETAAAEPKPAEPAATTAPAASSVAVQAVEIEGKKVFVAGAAVPGRSVRVYANEILIGETRAAPNGRFLVEAERDLPVGNYIIRADVLGDDGLQVVARAAVPFEREPGETIAAVAPPAPAQAAAAEQAPAAAAPKPAETLAPAAAPAQPGHAGEQPPAMAAAEPPASGSSDLPKPAAEVASNPSEVTAPKLKAVESAVIIRRGDTLWRISRRVYGLGVRYSTIYLANQDQISDPDRIWPGQVFSVPDKTDEGEAADMKAMGEQMTSKAEAAKADAAKAEAAKATSSKTE